MTAGDAIRMLLHVEFGVLRLSKKVSRALKNGTAGKICWRTTPVSNERAGEQVNSRRLSDIEYTKTWPPLLTCIASHYQSGSITDRVFELLEVP